MIETSLDVLWLTLAGGLGLLLISLSVMIWHLIGSIKRMNRLADTVESVLGLVDTYLRLPMTFIYKAMKWWKNK